MDLKDIVTKFNVAEDLDKDTLSKIAATVVEHYNTDLDSRSEWDKKYIQWQKVATQVIGNKSTPWPGAANIKYPLVTNACLQFNSRVVPALMPNSEPVGAAPIGPDADGQRRQIADAVARHMNYQVVHEMDEWEEEQDKMLLSLSMTGTEFKKVYFDSDLGRNVSRHVSPSRLIVNYYCNDFKHSRKTELFFWNKNKLMERIRAGVFLDVDWDNMPDPMIGQTPESEEEISADHGRDEPSKIDAATPYTVLEYHGWYDLDGDGYEEPYIITVLEQHQQVLSIIPRFTEDEIEWDGQGNLIRIEPLESYTPYIFIPSFDGGFYGLGFGQLLFPINDTVNTTINQLLDNGTLNNLSGGFISRGVGMRAGGFNMKPGKWLQVNAHGDDLRKGIVPLPIREPSSVLLSLMSYMIEAGEKMSGTTDIFMGEMPGQNTKATVSQMVREEGQKVFTAIYKRMRRALRDELQALYQLNFQVLASGYAQDTKIARSAQVFGVTAEMYQPDALLIVPSADPNMAIKEQRLQKEMQVMNQIMATGIGNLPEAQRRMFRTMEVERLEEVMPEDAAPPPDPGQQMAMMQQEMANVMQNFQMQLEADRHDWQKRMDTLDMQIKLFQVKEQAMSNEHQANLNTAQFEAQLQEAERAREQEAINAASQAPTEGDTGGMG